MATALPGLDEFPKVLVNTRTNEYHREWSSTTTALRQDCPFTGPTPGYTGSCTTGSVEFDYFEELFGEAARFVVTATNRQQRRLAKTALKQRQRKESRVQAAAKVPRPSGDGATACTSKRRTRSVHVRKTCHCTLIHCITLLHTVITCLCKFQHSSPLAVATAAARGLASAVVVSHGKGHIRRPTVRSSSPIITRTNGRSVSRHLQSKVSKLH